MLTRPFASRRLSFRASQGFRSRPARRTVIVELIRHGRRKRSDHAKSCSATGKPKSQYFLPWKRVKSIELEAGISCKYTLVPLLQYFKSATQCRGYRFVDVLEIQGSDVLAGISTLPEFFHLWPTGVRNPGGTVVLSSAATLSPEGVDAATSGPGEVGRNFYGWRTCNFAALKKSMLSLLI